MPAETKTKAVHGEVRSIAPVPWNNAIMFGLIATVIFLGIVFLTEMKFGEIYLTDLFLRRSPIQWLIMWCFFTALMGLAYKRIEVIKQLKGFTLSIFPSKAGRIEMKDVPNLLARKEISQGSQEYALIYRVKQALERVHATNSTKDLIPVLDALAAVDRAIMEASFAGIRFLIYAMPVLGFIGTVYGIGMGIRGFEGVIAGAENFMAIKPNLISIAKFLGVAFDTTLLGLTCSAITVLLTTLQYKREDDLLSQIEGYCIENLVNRLEERDPGTMAVIGGLGEVREVIQSVTQEIRNHPIGRSVELLEDVRNSVQHVGVQIKESVEQVRDNLAKQIERLAELLEQVVQSVNALPSLAENLRGVMEPVSESLRETSNHMSNTVDALRDVGDKMRETASRWEQLTASLEQVRTTIEQMLKIADIAEQLGKISEAISSFPQKIDALLEVVALLRQEVALVRGSDGQGQNLADIVRLLEELNRSLLSVLTPIQSISDVVKSLDIITSEVTGLRGDHEHRVDLSIMVGALRDHSDTLRKVYESVSQLSKQAEELIDRVQQIQEQSPTAWGVYDKIDLQCQAITRLCDSLRSAFGVDAPKPWTTEVLDAISNQQVSIPEITTLVDRLQTLSQLAQLPQIIGHLLYSLAEFAIGELQEIGIVISTDRSQAIEKHRKRWEERMRECQQGGDSNAQASQ